MSKLAPSFVVAIAVCCPLATVKARGQAPPAEHRFAREDVLGTSLTLIVAAPDDGAAQRLEASVVAEIERLAAILSSHDERSELRGYLAAAARESFTAPASRELREVLATAARWNQASQGAFHPGVAAACERWQQAAAAGELPSDAELSALAASLRTLPWQANADGRVTFAHGAKLTLDALAKGYIIDQACKLQADGGKTKVLLLAIGGDLRIAAGAPRPIAVADPRQPADNAKPLCTLQLAGKAVASSGNYKRGFTIGERQFSHVIDPRTARPAASVRGATVVADDCCAADALATALNVLEPTEGLALIAKTSHAEAVIVDRDGKVHESKGWTKLVAPSAVDAAAPSAAANELQVDFEINQPNADGRSGRRGRGGGYRRPYVAVWVESPDGKPVRTLCLWIERDRWLPDLQRWYRLNKANRGIVDAVSQATRKPGKYHLTWDGKDDDGKTVSAGHFTLCIEAAREHGTYQIMRQAFDWNGKAFAHELPANVEIKSASVSFGKKAQ